MSKVDWSKAPEDAQFYSFGELRKQVDGKEYEFYAGRWIYTSFDDMPVHKNNPDFELRPEPAVSDESTLEEEEAFAEIEAKSEAEDEAEVERWDGEGLPPAGRKCLMKCVRTGKVRTVTIEAAKKMNENPSYVFWVMAEVDSLPRFEFITVWDMDVEFYPVKSDRDKFISNVLYIFDEKFPNIPFPGGATGLIGMVYDAMVRGDLPVPKVDK